MKARVSDAVNDKRSITIELTPTRKEFALRDESGHRFDIVVVHDEEGGWSAYVTLAADDGFQTEKAALQQLAPAAEHLLRLLRAAVPGEKEDTTKAPSLPSLASPGSPANRDETSIRSDERRKMALDGLNEIIRAREAFGAHNHEVLACLQRWLNREAGA